MLALDLCGHRRIELHRHGHVLAAHTHPVVVGIVERHGVGEGFAFGDFVVLENHLAKEVAGAAKALALREFFGFLHAALPGELVVIYAETLELVHLTDSDAILGEAVATDHFAAIRIGKDKAHRGIGFDVDPFRSIYFKENVREVGTAKLQVEGAERSILNEFGETICRIRESLNDNALDFAAFVRERHDELVGFDGDGAGSDNLRGGQRGGVGGGRISGGLLCRFAPRNDVSRIFVCGTENRAAFCSATAPGRTSPLAAGASALSTTWAAASFAAAFLASFAFSAASLFALVVMNHQIMMAPIRMDPMRVFLFITFPFWAEPGHSRPCKTGCTLKF